MFVIYCRQIEEEVKVSLSDLVKDHHEKMTEIKNNQRITVTAMQGDMQYFYFEITEPMVITVKYHKFLFKYLQSMAC